MRLSICHDIGFVVIVTVHRDFTFLEGFLLRDDVEVEQADFCVSLEVKIRLNTESSTTALIMVKHGLVWRSILVGCIQVTGARYGSVV